MWFKMPVFLSYVKTYADDAKSKLGSHKVDYIHFMLNWKYWLENLIQQNQ